jgi:hypothetical protein
MQLLAAVICGVILHVALPQIKAISLLPAGSRSTALYFLKVAPRQHQLVQQFG